MFVVFVRAETLAARRRLYRIVREATGGRLMRVAADGGDAFACPAFLAPRLRREERLKTTGRRHGWSLPEGKDAALPARRRGAPEKGCAP